jgi:hypothetical protein
VPRFRKSIAERGNNRGPARPTFGGYAARKSPMWTGSWHAYGEILRNSAIGAARLLHKWMRPRVVRIATTGQGVPIEIMGRGATIEIMGQGPMTGTTGQGLTTVQGLTRITTNKVEYIIPQRDSRPHQRSEFSVQRVRPPTEAAYTALAVAFALRRFFVLAIALPFALDLARPSVIFLLVLACADVGETRSRQRRGAGYSHHRKPVAWRPA